MGTKRHERMLTTLNPPCGRASDGNAGTQINTYYFGAALLKSSLWERRDTNGCLWERRDIRIDACRWERLAECSQKPFGLHLSPNSTPYIRPIYFWRFFLLVVN